MEFTIDTWPVSQLLGLLDAGQLNLNPPYQRNPIWPKRTQKFLIESMRNGHPFPNLFLFRKPDAAFDMVDGQQRTRALRLYQTTNEIDLGGDADFKANGFINFPVSIIIITAIAENESIEDFYYMVNSSGIKLNRPETLKAQYFDKRFLQTVEELTTDDHFQALNIIPPSSQKRMLDRDLVEELCSLILYNITDKKIQVDRIYESDISEEQATTCTTVFRAVIQKLESFNHIRPIRSTRYRQRNDFYTLFGFLKDNLALSDATLNYFYDILLVLEPAIRPNREACPPLAEYAFNCVSQSNSTAARRTRRDIFIDLLLNTTAVPNQRQLQVAEYFPAQGEYFSTIEHNLTFNVDVLRQGIAARINQE
jgi:hypothetical protein